MPLITVAHRYTNSCAKHLPHVFGTREPDMSPEIKMLAKILDVAATSHDSLDGAGAKQFLAKHKPMVLDVRPSEQYHAGLRAADAKSAPLTELLEGVTELPEDRDTPLLVYCNRGVDSLYAMTLLKSKGYGRVAHVVDGMFEWWRHGLPTENTGKPLPFPKNKAEKETVKEYKDMF